MRRRLSATVVGALVAGLAPVSVAGAQPGPAATYEPEDIVWEPCDDFAPGLECGQVEVPIDYADPDRATLEIAVSRLAATDPATRRGVLLLNPGGPGGSGLLLPLYIAQLTSAYPEVRATFDLVGFDPRFVGYSTPVSCGLTVNEMDVPRWPEGDFDGEVEFAHTIADKCAANAGWALPHASSLNVARDMDVVRAALGEDRISYLGYSYGATLGRDYLSLYPDRVDRFVLDSNTHPFRTGRADDRAFGPNFERMLNLFTRFVARDPARYGMGADARTGRRNFDALIAQAEEVPIEAGDEVFTARDIRVIAFRLLYAENRFDWLGRFVKTLREGQPLPDDIAFLANLRRFLPIPGVPLDNFIAVYHLISCGDDAYPRDVDRYEREHAIDSARYPFAGPAWSNISPCAFWPELDREPTPSIVGNRTHLLLVNSTGDPATPYDGALATRLLMPNARLVTVVANHHAVFGEYPSACVEEAVVDYLVYGVKRDVLCLAAAGAASPAGAAPVSVGVIG
ncbi:MAG: alpha/beta hydrolase [Acidimicrobiales bacterium]